MPLPEVGDILYRAHAHVGNTRFAQDVVSVQFDSWQVVRVTRCKMWLAQWGIVQPWEALPGCMGREPGRNAENCIELTEAQVMDRIRDAGTQVCNRAARVMFAWPTRELALESLRARTGWRVHHARRALERALAVESFLTGKTAEEVEPPRLAELNWSILP